MRAYPRVPGPQEARRHLRGPLNPSELGVYTDGNLVTASGPGFAVDFGLALLALLEGRQAADDVAAGMLVAR